MNGHHVTKRYFSLLVLLVLFQTSCTGAASPAPAPTPSFTPSPPSTATPTPTPTPSPTFPPFGGGGWITFYSEQGSQCSLYAVRPDGGDPIPLAGYANPQQDSCYFGHTLIGEQLYFYTENEDACGLFVMDLTSGETIRLGEYDPSPVRTPCRSDVIASPDGNRIAFTTFARFTGSNTFDDIRILDLGTGQISSSINHDIIRLFGWSPDGKQVSLWTDSGTTLVDVDGNGTTRLTGEFGYVSWSPADSTTALGGQGLYLLRPDAQERILITDLGTYFPVWSNDGSRIAFTESMHGFCIVDADGTDLNCYFENARINSSLSWSPDGSALLFSAVDVSSTPDENVSTITTNISTVYLMSPDGSNIRTVYIDGRFPRWSPDGSRIVFTCIQEGMPRICTIAPDGSDLIALSPAMPEGAVPFWWSP